MTAYFDQKAREITKLSLWACASPCREDVYTWVQSLRTDISICCEYDRDGPWAFPADLRDRAYMMFLRASANSWPDYVPGYGVDYEHDVDGMRLLSKLVEDLHDLFHEAAQMGWLGGDDPRSSVHRMDAEMEARCEVLISENPSLNICPDQGEEAADAE